MADERITNPSARTIAERNKFLSYRAVIEIVGDCVL